MENSVEELFSTSHKSQIQSRNKHFLLKEQDVIREYFCLWTWLPSLGRAALYQEGPWPCVLTRITTKMWIPSELRAPVTRASNHTSAVSKENVLHLVTVTCSQAICTLCGQVQGRLAAASLEQWWLIQAKQGPGTKEWELPWHQLIGPVGASSGPVTKLALKSQMEKKCLK